MFSPVYSAGGVHVPHPMFMSFQNVPNAPRMSYIPALHPFPFPPFTPNAFPPLHRNGILMGHYNSDCPPQPRKLFIGGLSHETTDEQLRQYYSQWGTVVDCIVIRDPQTKYSRGFGFVTFATIQMAEAAMADRPHTINNKACYLSIVVDPKRAIPREQMSPLLPNHPPSFLEIEPDPGCKLSLSGIHWAWHTVDDLRQYFDNFGTVEQVEILGNPRGLGFVVFENKSSADKCLEHGKIHIINGQKCEITRNPIEHSIFQRNDTFDGNDSEIIDEQADSASASGQETPDDGSTKTLENGFANSLSFAEPENACTSCDADTAQKPKGGVGHKKIVKLSKMEKEEANAKCVRETGDKKDMNDKRDRKTQLVKNDKKKAKKTSRN
uniref:RRM domain-containing protein n=1 Tax=Setaria digitata TaxID=48799 RepID=A0A915PWS8_9BILA